jgi:hypothetical protein
MLIIEHGFCVGKTTSGMVIGLCDQPCRVSKGERRDFYASFSVFAQDNGEPPHYA